MLKLYNLIYLLGKIYTCVLKKIKQINKNKNKKNTKT